ncbi:uncharacterized protein EI90DRAFT_3125526 [Cantharellus anzutake]|uniref:uncharacterized protein n=1 Tax=Cantharellus anzutake TaxID=1750568 RepID=UPI0019036D55|nr:uncharacterized protein EI90DRAFT_3125526 [Cantharellus anzutake]KAF8328782.1 hypothetical protein EI90DRAFT_3125526 [Cantharellus anzutake]
MDLEDVGELKYSCKEGPVISTVAPSHIRELLISRTPYTWSTAGELGIAAVKRQLEVYEESLKDVEDQKKLSADASLFDAVATKIATSLNVDPSDDIKAIMSLPQSVLRRAVGRWDKLPYHAFCIARRSAEGAVDGGLTERLDAEAGGALSSDVDEWILRNEAWLRNSQEPKDWSRGLVRFSQHANAVFQDSTLSVNARVLSRSSMSGYKILDRNRASSIKIQPNIGAFASVFSVLSDGLLKGVDWNNVFAAGGIALSSLLCTDVKADALIFKNSDIDLYIHGLGPTEANKKIQHIYDVWKSNLPKDADSRVARNSRTITLFGPYPTRRIQIVLKLVRDPKEILLNFDLDICSMGWDGKELYLLPRAARALQTGYNVFTMNLINGHYLGERRASQEERYSILVADVNTVLILFRVFKYADRGYGIRFLPSYVDSLPRDEQALDVLSLGQEMQHTDMNRISRNSECWITKLLNIRFFNGNPLDLKGPKPALSHASISEISWNSTDTQGRSCLSSFERLMRHVWLWGRALDNTTFASVDYTENSSPVGYDETPHYAWNEKFKFADFESAIFHVNEKELDQLENNMSECGYPTRWNGLHPRAGSRFEEIVVDANKVGRMVIGKSLEKVLGSEGDFLIPLWLPEDFVSFANETIKNSLAAHHLPVDIEPLCLISNQPLQDTDASGNLRPYYWHIDRVCAWQKIDRRIDEIFEVLWAFHSANATLAALPEERMLSFITQLSKRAIRKGPDDEMASFARWVGRVPGQMRFSYSDNWYNMEYNDEDDEWAW